jgi:peptidoglycan/LPS O-acetylase OafA/YrhL
VAETEHLAFIDALRGWAFLAVLAVHAGVADTAPEWLWKYKLCGKYGVQLFFVISALTLFMSYESRRARDRNPVAAFFTRRLFRIAPLFWMAVLFYPWYQGLGPRASAPDGIGWPQIVATGLFLHGWYPTSINSVVPGGWSIAVEMNFYLILPLCYAALTNLRRAVVGFGAAFLASSAIGWVMNKWLIAAAPPEMRPVDELFLYYWFPRQMPVFLLGFILYFLLKRLDRVGRRDALAGDRGWSSVLPTAIALGLILLLVLVGDRVKSTHILFSCAFAMLGFGLALRPVYLLVNPVTCYVGKVSYSAYITHFFVLDEFARFTSSPGARAQLERHPVAAYVVSYVLCLAGTMMISTATHYLMEIPGQNIGKWVIQRFGWGRPSMASAPV